MALTVQIRGTTAILKWGTYTYAGTIVSDSNITTSSENDLIENEQGQTVNMISNYGGKISGRVTFIPFTGTALSSFVPGGTADIAITYNAQIFLVVSVTQRNARRNVEMWDLELLSSNGLPSS